VVVFKIDINLQVDLDASLLWDQSATTTSDSPRKTNDIRFKIARARHDGPTNLSHTAKTNVSLSPSHLRFFGPDLLAAYPHIKAPSTSSDTTTRPRNTASLAERTVPSASGTLVRGRKSRCTKDTGMKY
jgi:hypothetical protein